MTPDQILSEIAGVIALIDRFYKVFGFKYHVELSTCPEDFMGTQEQKEIAEGTLKNVLSELGMSYVINEGDGAFYGPKIDFHLEDSIGRTWQCGTIQLDFQMPECFDLTYTGADGERHRPVMIHRVVFGSIERFIGILIEHFAGAFPLWLAPVQAVIIPVNAAYNEYALQIKKMLDDVDIRTEIDDRNEKLGYKIREAQLQKTPYMFVLGQKEQDANEITVRSHKDGDMGMMKIDEVIDKLLLQIATKQYQ
jgi:threonyl-tRNA synthetase